MSGTMSMLCLILVYLGIQTSLATDSISSQPNSLNNTDNTTLVENSCLQFRPQSCAGVCGQFFSLWCSCDEYCQVYGRCCFDYQTVCKEESEKARRDHKNLMNVTIECDINISGSNVPQQIITSCSLTKVSTETIELCQTNSRSSAVVSKVMSRRTQLHYKNRYCMLCNGEVEDDIIYWPTMVGTIGRKKRIYSVQNILDLFDNSIRITPPPNSREIICFPEVIMSCLSQASSEQQRLCEENALSPIVHYGLVYKNTFCLQCSVELQPDDNNCNPATKDDIYYGQLVQSFIFSMILNWKRDREATVSISSQLSLIKSLSCWLDSHDNVKRCEIKQCVGTLSVLNQTCTVIDNHFGCIQYIFHINFTVPSGSNSDIVLNHVYSNLVRAVASVEHQYNVSKYYSKDVELRNISLVNDQVTGLIYVERMVYNLCDLEYKSLGSRFYFEYLDLYLDVNLDGGISTCRYTVDCHDWCNGDTCLTWNHQLTFRGDNTTDSNLTSSMSKLTPIWYIYLLSLILIFHCGLTLFLKALLQPVVRARDRAISEFL